MGHPAARARRGTRGFGSNIGNLGGLLLWAMLFTAGLGIVQVARYHATLTQAAQVALTSEAQNGCWTAATTQAVTATMQGTGLNPTTVQVQSATVHTVAYGHAIQVGLATTVTLHWVGLTWSLPLTVAVTGTSFYVPAAAGEANPACTTATLGGTT